jgi:prepilin-type N-terminal cleavage/methylation domain-containing protein
MAGRQAFTIAEILVVLVIIGLVAAFWMPNFTASTEQARALSAQNNLLAIYTAEQNYNNNVGSYCLGGAASAACAATGDGKCANSIADINCNLSMGIQDDGTYTYACSGTTCKATRAGGTLLLTLNLKQPVVANGGNPSCTGTTSWCPP